MANRPPASCPPPSPRPNAFREQPNRPATSGPARRAPRQRARGASRFLGRVPGPDSAVRQGATRPLETRLGASWPEYFARAAHMAWLRLGGWQVSGALNGRRPPYVRPLLGENRKAGSGGRLAEAGGRGSQRLCCLAALPAVVYVRAWTGFRRVHGTKRPARSGRLRHNEPRLHGLASRAASSPRADQPPVPGAYLPPT
jgi:hypothetical protein